MSKRKDRVLQNAQLIIESYNELFHKGTNLYLREAEKIGLEEENDVLLSSILSDNEDAEESVTGRYDPYMLDNMGRKIISGLTQEIHKVFNYRDGLYKKWTETPLKGLESTTPRTFFEEIEDLETLTKIFILYAVKSDYKMPDVFLSRIRQWENEAIEQILKLAIGKANSYFNMVSDKNVHIKDSIRDDITISLAAIEVLGDWKVKSVVAPLITLMLNMPSIAHWENIMGESDKIMFDEVAGYLEMYRAGIRDALISIGNTVTGHLLKIFEAIPKYTENHEYLAMALAETGRKNKSDKIFKTLKNIFLKMDNKIVGSSCLSTYGDGRAVIVLRGYVKKNISELDRETFYEIKGAVESLGGTMDDIKFHDPFDFF